MQEQFEGENWTRGRATGAFAMEVPVIGSASPTDGWWRSQGADPTTT